MEAAQREILAHVLHTRARAGPMNAVGTTFSTRLHNLLPTRGSRGSGWWMNRTNGGWR